MLYDFGTRSFTCQIFARTLENFLILQVPVQSGSSVTLVRPYSDSLLKNPLMSLTVDSTSPGTEDNTSVSEGLSTKVTAVDKEGDAKYTFYFMYRKQTFIYYGSFTLPETDLGTESESDSCP